MAKVLLINPVVREESDPKHIPYGLALCASIAIEKGHLVQFYDENAHRLGDEVIAQVCGADDWDVIAIGGLTTTYSNIKKILKIAKRVSPRSLIVAGGGFLTSMPREVMDWLPEIDLGVIGEAFVTWPEVLAKVDAKDLDFSSTLGVCFRDAQGKAHLTPVRPNIHDLDVLPYPAWDLLPLDIYFKNSNLLSSDEGFTAQRRIDMMGSVGCSLICRFCWHLGTSGDMVVEKNPEDGEMDVRFTLGRNIRYHSPAYIAGMAKALVEKYDIDFVSFVDENFMTMDISSGRTWLLELCEAWVAAGLQPTCRRDGVPHDRGCRGVHWSGTSHAGLLRKETLDAMFKAGCASLVYGLESFDPHILKTLGKGSTQKKNMEAVKLTLESGISPQPNLIIGFPDESFQSIRTMIECMKKIGLHSKPHFATPYPGSEWYYNYKESIIEQYGGNLEAFIEDLGDATKITAVISHRFSPLQLLGLQEIVHRRDLRLLDLAEKHWGRSDESTVPLAVPRASFNMVSKPVKAPLEPAARPI